MSDRKKPRSLSEIVNDVLRAVRDYYDSEYVYYIEKEYGDIETIFEWCAENVPWQRDKIKMLPEEQQPKWMKQEITNSTEADYSVSLQLDENTVAILAAVGVHRGGCDVGLLRTVIPYIPQAIALHKLQKQQEYLSYHDNLTGVLNRNSFVAYLDHVEPEELKTLGALSVDINGLKNSYEDFTQQVHGAYTKLENISLGLVSVGYAWGKVDIDVNGLVISAENMMREEKKKYYKNLRKGHHEPIIKKDLLEDIEQKNFIVCLVPKIDVQTGEIAGAEAIVRYHHKDLGIMDPGRYINLLEETRLSHYLDLYIFEQVCQILHKWETEGIQMVPISVNFAGETLRQENIADQMSALIEKYQVLCEYLEVEVSESYTDTNQEMLAASCSKIRKANVRVVLDHFGAKNSSFSILSIMDFDGLKLDESLITNLVGNRRSRVVAKAVIDICHQLGCSVLAESVETQDQLNVLQELGCDYAQGTLFNKPIKVETFEVRYLKE